MANMTYCMFENTLQDLMQIQEEIDHGNVDKDEMSSSELAAAEQMSEMLDTLKQDLEEMLE